jgi:uncharacterized protein YukE
MSNIPFYKTVMGRQFFEQQVPQILQEVKRIRKAMEQIASALEKNSDDKPEQEDKEQ